MKDKNNIKILNLRLPMDLWTFARKAAFEQNMSLNSLIVACVESYKKKCEKVLTFDDTMIP